MSFDLRAIVAGIPTDFKDVPVTFDLKLLAEVVELRAAADIDEKLLAKKEKELVAATYVFTVCAVSRDQRNDIHADLIERFPSRKLIGSDEGAEFQRSIEFERAVAAAGVVRITDPTGDSIEARDEIEDAMAVVYSIEPVFKRIATAVERESRQLDQQTELSKSADF